MSKAGELVAGEVSQHESCLPKKRGRPKNPWRIRVVRIDAQKYEGHRDRDHAFALMAVETRTQEIDAFCARLLARNRKSESAKVNPQEPVEE